MLALKNVAKAFTQRGRTRLILESVNFGIQKGEFVALVGASGCGKSTLLRMIAGLEACTGGEIDMDGQVITGPTAARAMVFQDYSLYPWLSVMDNVRFCRTLQAHQRNASISDGKSAIERSYALLELMGLAEAAQMYPSQLSGGMQQRVAIARALMARPQVLLMDEPFGALDAQTREVMHDLILHLHHHERTTTVFVTHDVEEALYLAGRVIVLAPAPGRVDSEWTSPLPASRERHQDMKMDRDFIKVKRDILHRIRITSGVATQQELLERIGG